MNKKITKELKDLGYTKEKRNHIIISRIFLVGAFVVGQLMKMTNPPFFTIIMILWMIGVLIFIDAEVD